MKKISFLLVVATISGILAVTPSASGRAGDEAGAGFGNKIPDGYRDWRLISVAHEAGGLNDIRAILGNDVAIKAYREEKLPFPEVSGTGKFRGQDTYSPEFVMVLPA